MGDDKPGLSEDNQKERSGSDRRSNIDRRSAIAPWKGVEHRQANRRKAVDRRGLLYGVFYKTDESLDPLYDWLRDHCHGKWSVGLEEAEENPLKKSVKVLFELKSDKKTFIQDIDCG